MSEEICICLVIFVVILIYDYLTKKQKKSEKKKRKEAVQAYKNKVEKQKRDTSLDEALISLERNEARDKQGSQLDYPTARRVTYARGPERAYI